MIQEYTEKYTKASEWPRTVVANWTGRRCRSAILSSHSPGFDALCACARIPLQPRRSPFVLCPSWSINRYPELVRRATCFRRRTAPSAVLPGDVDRPSLPTNYYASILLLLLLKEPASIWPFIPTLLLWAPFRVYIGPKVPVSRLCTRRRRLIISIAQQWLIDTQ